ncbi:MAG: FimV/HubP family polar landmark protein, partial [Pseudomonadota bacterium]|nr:FimV/HubP family polar landmark protein [Pseudomonadota bacterium]
KRATPIAQPSQSIAEPSEGSTPDDFSNFELELDVPASAMSADGPQEEDTFPTTLEDTGTPNPDATLSESGSSGAAAVDSEERTQLELANAYLEMGDPASAREILTARAHSGDSDIQERAKKLLETLSGSA